MKKIVFILAVLSSFAALANEYNIYTKVGAGFTSSNAVGDAMLADKFDSEKLVQFDLKRQFIKSFNLNLEVTTPIYDQFEVGAGLAYIHDIARTYVKKDDANQTFRPIASNMLPIYLVGKMNFDIDSAFRPYVAMNLGYAFSSTSGYSSTIQLFENSDFTKKSIKTGLAIGLQAGVEYENFLGELYIRNVKSHLDTMIKNTARKEDFNNLAVGLNLGYKINL